MAEPYVAKFSAKPRSGLQLKLVDGRVVAVQEESSAGASGAGIHSSADKDENDDEDDEDDDDASGPAANVDETPASIEEDMIEAGVNSGSFWLRRNHLDRFTQRYAQVYAATVDDSKKVKEPVGALLARVGNLYVSITTRSGP
jgi:hypothetical protein